MDLEGFDDGTSVVGWGKFNQYSDRLTGEDEDAFIHTHMEYGYRLGGIGRAANVTSATMKITVLRDSWVVTSQMTDYLLKHEQGHYDIQALVAREFLEEIKKVAAPSDHDASKLIKDLEKKYGQLTKTTNIRYDAATNHSLNKQVQQTWDQRIDAAKKNKKGTINDLP